jgi:hypothetical protein
MKKFGRYLLKAIGWHICCTAIATGVLLVMVGRPDLSVMGSVIFLGGVLLASLVAIPVYMAYEWVWEALSE